MRGAKWLTVGHKSHKRSRPHGSQIRFAVWPELKGDVLIDGVQVVGGSNPPAPTQTT
jgi:hypothetical protein